ncbi:MAG: DUF58 domain-containing protein [Planctomycetota bacterium]
MLAGMEAASASHLVRPEILGQLHSLQVAARAIVEGLRAGAHRSPHKGHSVDFADHRQYVPGDDLRHLDWKVLGRRDRLVIKRYEAEIDLGCTLAVDGSGSMAYRGQRAAVDKYRYASLLAASLAYLVLKQQDRVGLQLFSETGLVELAPARQGQLDRLCHHLESHRPELGTDAAKGLELLATPNRRRGLVVLLSDCMAALADLETAIDRLRHRGHDVALIWLLDPDEVDLSVPSVSRFLGLESDGELVAEPRALRRAYVEQVERHRLGLEQLCLGRKVVFVSCTTDQPPQIPLNQLLVGLQHDAR